MTSILKSIYLIQTRMHILPRISSLINGTDSLQGKLLYCHPPPHINATDFQPKHKNFVNRDSECCDLSATANKQKIKRIENVVDKDFFHEVLLAQCLPIKSLAVNGY